MEEGLATGPDSAVPSSAAATTPTVAAVTELTRLDLINSRWLERDRFDVSEEDDSKSDFINNSHSYNAGASYFDRYQAKSRASVLRVNRGSRNDISSVDRGRQMEIISRSRKGVSLSGCRDPRPLQRAKGPSERSPRSAQFIGGDPTNNSCTQQPRAITTHHRNSGEMLDGPSRGAQELWLVQAMNEGPFFTIARKYDISCFGLIRPRFQR